MCTDCLHRFAASTCRCERCGLCMPQATPACGQCLRTPPAFERTLCAVDYTFPWNGLVAAFKYQGRVDLAGSLTACLADALGDHIAWPDVVVPIPLAPDRLRERGYNQAWELARRLGRHADRPVQAHALARLHSGPHQAGVDRETRLRQARGAFVADQRQAIEGRRVALVDDVMTTGATVSEAARTLLLAGATAVQVWVLARTP